MSENNNINSNNSGRVVELSSYDPKPDTTSKPPIKTIPKKIIVKE